MASAETLKIGIEAQLKNFEKIIQSISDGLSKGLVDGIDEKTLDKIQKRLKTAFAQFDIGNFTDALKKMDEVASGLVRAVEAINVAAGAASSELVELTENLKKAQKAADDLKAANPAARYRPIKDDKERVVSYVRSKAGLNREAVGITDWAQGKASFTGTDGTPTEIDYGGKTWSVNSAVANLVKALNKGTLELSAQLKKAFNEFGFKVSGSKPGEYSAERQDLTIQRTNEINKWSAEVAAADLVVAEAKAKVDEAELNADKIKITAETGEFVTPLEEVVKGQKNVLDLQEQNNKLNEDANKALHRKSDAEEAARDAADAHAKSIKQGTDAINKNNGAVTKAVTTFFGYQMVLRQLRKLWREAIHTITELDKQLTNQAIVTNMTREETWKLVATYQDLADQLGVTQTEIASVTTEYLRQGETLQDALVLTKAATSAATVAGISAQDSVKYLTTAIHGFKLEAEDALAVSDKFAALAAQAATNYEDLAIALSKVASQASLAGMSMDYTLALLTTGLDITQEAPESIGTALKTVIARMREISDYGKTLEDNTNLNQVEAGLKAVGVELRNGIGELRSTEDVLDDLGRKWRDLSANQQAAVAKALAGTRQQSRLVAIMENYDDVLKNMTVSQESLGATTAQQVDYLKGMEAAVNRLQNAYQALIERVVNSDFVIWLVDTVTSFLKYVQKFLDTGAGKVAFFSMITAIVLQSKELVDKIRNTISQIVKMLSGVHEEEERITLEKQKQLETYKKQVMLQAGVSEEQMDKAGYGKTERPNGWLSNRPGESTLTDVIGALFKVGPGWKERISATTKSWQENNTLWAKWQEHRDQKKNDAQTVKNAITRTEEQIKQTQKTTAEEIAKQEEALAEARKRTQQASEQATQAEEAMNQAMLEGDMSPEGLATPDAYTKAEEARKKAMAEEAEIEAQIKALREAGVGDEEDLQKTLKILNSKQLSDAERVAYLAHKRAIAENKTYTQEELTDAREAQARGDRLTAAQQEVLRKAEVVENAQREVAAIEGKNSGKQTGGKLSKIGAGAANFAAAASMAISMIQGMVETIQNRYKEIAEKSIEKASEIQSEIYENTKTMANLKTLSSDLQKLDKQVIKTAETMSEISDLRSQLISELELEDTNSAAYTNQQLYDMAMAKRDKLQQRNNELLQDLGDTLLGAANNYDFGAGALNIIGKLGQGAAIGGMISAGLNAIPGIGNVASGAITAISAAVGAVVGIVEEISKLVAANDAKGKVHELLQNDQGVEQMQYYLKAVYKNTIDTSTIAGEELANAVKTTYASLMDNLTGDDIEKLLDQYNWNVGELSASISNTLADNSEAMTNLTRDSANYQERVKAATELASALYDESEILGDAFMQQYGAYVELGALLGEQVAVMDEYKWSMTDMQALLTQLAEDGKNPEQMRQAIQALGEAMKDGILSTEELTTVFGGMSDAARKAAVEMMSGLSMQDLADQFTYARSQVDTIRETQGKWDSMSASDRQRFIDENEDFFNIAGAREAFYNGEDISQYIEQYKAELQEQLKAATEDKIVAQQAEVYRLEQLLASVKEGSDAWNEYYKQLQTAKRGLKDLENTYMDVEGMFELTLSDVVKKQNDQIAKLKEMYKAEEQALTDSLNKRKEAYQKYFDTLASQDAAADYAQNRNQLMESISRLSGGTDATSRNKTAELRRQLAQLEQEEAKRKTEEARQAVLQNIDDQVQQIQKQFDELLNNNQALLAKIDENTEMQYLQFLKSQGFTDEDYELRVKQLADLLRGRWTKEGLQSYQATSIPVSVPDVSSPEVNEKTNNTLVLNTTSGEETVHLTNTQMRQLVDTIFATINRMAGTSYTPGTR